jgi:nicotinate-nucleotide--dimethylbenzimidazole phosphoribosyltransferase
VLEQTIAAIRPLDPGAMAAARALHARLTKPAGSLGALEELSVRLAGLAGTCPPPLPEPAAVAVFAGDHGVHAQGVTPWPQEVTAQMVANILAGGAVVNAFARQVGASVTVVDVGVAAAIGWDAQVGGGVIGWDAKAGGGVIGWDAKVGGGVTDGPIATSHEACRNGTQAALDMNVRRGTRDLAVEPALTRDEAVAALDAGIRVAGDLVEAGARALLTGDMGIANTTPAAALIAAFTGTDAAAVTGRGTGVDDGTYARKVAVVRRAMSRISGDADALAMLAEVGGLEHAAIAGFILGAAARRVPVILDGVSAVAAALVATALAPDCVGAMVAGHRSAEPGATVALRHLGLDPLVDLGMRLGEGTGAALALPIVAGAVRVLHDVATFDSAGVSEK